MTAALLAWLSASEGAGEASAPEACAAAAAALRADPWEAVSVGGLLARCAVTRADTDLGLTAKLAVVDVDDPSAVARVGRGQRFPLADRQRRRGLGAFDTPPFMARALAAQALEVHGAPPRRALDPACGAGALLLALAERGVGELIGADADPCAVAVAQVVLPGARILVRDVFEEVEAAELVLTNPPFVSPEAQDKALRRRLAARFPWLAGRFDLSVPFLAALIEAQAPGTTLGLVLPAPLLAQGYAAPLRRRWLRAHRLASLGPRARFPSVGVDVFLCALRLGEGPAPMPWAGGPSAEELLSLLSSPIDPRLRAGDVSLAERVRARSVELGALCEVDTGLVAHGPGGGKARLLSAEPGEGRVPYVDARDFFAGGRRWLDYSPERMHRAKRPALFEAEKILIQRLRGAQPVRADIDREGLYAGHTLTVARPLSDAVPIERLLHLIRSPLSAGLLRVASGHSLDLYPKQVRRMPVPRRWASEPELPLAEAWGLSADEVARLLALSEGDA